MRRAVRAIIVENGQLLVMQRNKYGSHYFTLVGGAVQEGESDEQALIREVREETGMTVTAATLMFIEKHPAPYNEQYIYYCNVAPHNGAAIQPDSEEGEMNTYGANTHQPAWIRIRAFADLPFRTPQLHEALTKAFKKGFPKEPVHL
jgi:8-oxo-dGTP diphosphatase